MTEGALHGLTVVEYSHGVAAAFAGKLLSDFGARVVKVEDPRGDPSRKLPPLVPSDGSALFAYLNTGKDSVTVNQASTAGRRVFRDMVRRADVLVEDLSPGQSQRLGVSYRSMCRVNRALVMVSITGFGRSGPRAGYRSTDLVNVAAGGLALTMPNADEKTGVAVPLRPGGTFSHFAAGLNAAITTLAALMRRNATGSGAYIDMSEQEAVLHNIARHVTQYTVEGKLPVWALSKSYGGGGGIMKCKDGYIMFHVAEEHFWQALLDVMGRPAWSRDERFRRRDVRFANWDKLQPHLDEWCGARSAWEIFHACQARGIPCAPVSTPDRLVSDPHIIARKALIQVDGLTMPGAPVRLAVTPHAVRHPAPALGQHTEDVLGEWLGYTPAKIAALRKSHAV
ncbi:MAG: CoA transferase [Dehalococcoidia bacterium]|nr:CoA transferase [Dehalococcoidia bacterium]